MGQHLTLNFFPWDEIFYFTWDTLFNLLTYIHLKKLNLDYLCWLQMNQNDNIKDSHGDIFAKFILG